MQSEPLVFSVVLTQVHIRFAQMLEFSSSVLVCFFIIFLLSYYLISAGDRITVLVFIYLQIYTGIVLLTLSGPKTCVYAYRVWCRYHSFTTGDRSRTEFAEIPRHPHTAHRERGHT